MDRIHIEMQKIYAFLLRKAYDSFIFFELKQRLLAERYVFAIFIQIVTGRKLHTSDLTLKKLHNEMGFKAVFIGIGLPEPKHDPVFNGMLF